MNYEVYYNGKHYSVPEIEYQKLQKAQEKLLAKYEKEKIKCAH